MRLFVALVPPPDVVEDLDSFLDVRREAGSDLRWTSTEQWHVTLAFMPEVAPSRLDELHDRLMEAAEKHVAFEVRLRGGGAFPDPSRAKVLWAGVDEPGDLTPLATAVRSAANRSGVTVDGGRFRAHLTLARSGRPFEATRWVRVLDTYVGPTWTAESVSLVESQQTPAGHRVYTVLESCPFA